MKVPFSIVIQMVRTNCKALLRSQKKIQRRLDPMLFKTGLLEKNKNPQEELDSFGFIWKINS